MAFIGKPVRKQTALGEAVQSKFKQDLSQFEQSLKDMQTCLKAVNDTVAEHYGELLPRSNEFQRALQDENTLVENFIKETHDVGDNLRRYSQEYSDTEADDSPVSSANRTSEFATSVLGAMFKGQNVFFSESSKVSQVLLDIVSQTKYTPTPREIKLTRELQEKLEDKPVAARGWTGRPPAASAVSPFATAGGGHRGLGTLIGGAYGSQQPQSKGVSAQIKPASRFSSPPSTVTGGTRIYI
ncbi:uncharacterized protein LOC110976012 isoform X2 [Acanthaster planci]|uniref:Uncharacterized protein LOC110976012 isoform X1 n=1 Tax=Acanthaster planci TaxID=133434 RepID=A0A8B7XWI0_ACAPL|nr:uncharacterized protein LOC110976012 isoform X1 [Acanthaster planci]XP_022084613.1 uncharacterized protein LOC110976012 isoform X2 [Acanthaster planci]